jgi:hypothetical protein
MTDTAQPNAEPQAEDASNRADGEQANLEARTFTQADLDFHYAKAKTEERRKLQTKYGDLDELAEAKRTLDEKRAAEMSELEKLQKQLADKDAEIVKATKQAETERLNALRLRVGQEVGLPTVLAARLQGADETELKADAETVKAVMGNTGQARIPNIDATAGGGQQIAQARVKLTAAQMAIADQYGISHDKYAESLQQFEE